MFTVLIAVHNGSSWIEEAVQTVSEQTFKEWECLILDNGSTDNTASVAKHAIKNDNRFQYHRLEVANKANALNYGITLAQYDWLAICDVDDLWSPVKLQAQNEYISDNPDIDFLGTRFEYFGHGDDLPSKTPHLPVEHIDIVAWLDRCENPLATSSVVYRKDIHFRGAGFYNTMYFSVEDYEIWKKGRMRNMKFANLPAALMMHRIHPPSPYQTTNRQEISKAVVDVLYSDLTDVRRVAYFVELLQKFDSDRPKGGWSDGHSVR